MVLDEVDKDEDATPPGGVIAPEVIKIDIQTHFTCVCLADFIGRFGSLDPRVPYVDELFRRGAVSLTFLDRNPGE